MKKGILLIFTLIACQGSSLAQVLVGSNVVTEKSIYNKIVEGWSTCEAIVKEQSVAINALELVNKSDKKLIESKDSLYALKQKELDLSYEKINQYALTVDKLNKQLDIPCPKQKSFLLTPWPYVTFGLGSIAGIWLGTR